ncbi:MAG: S-layer homology domain-containing protein [Bacillota bacterium]|nr:S-layer homology domain-containing protein [Bacillota bacterium]
MKTPSSTRLVIDYGAYEFRDRLSEGELLMGVKLTMPEIVRNAFLDNAATKLNFTAPIKATYSLSTNYDPDTFKFTDQFPKNASGAFTPLTIDLKTPPAVVPFNLSEPDRQVIGKGDALWLTFRAPSTTRQFNLTSDSAFSYDIYARVSDDEYPTVKEISSPNKTFKAGEQVPIVVTFSEPIVQKTELTLTMQDDKGVEYTAKSVYNSTKPLTHSKVTFLYDIPPQASEILWSVRISGDTYDTSNKRVSAYTFPSGVERLATTFNYNEIDSMTGMTLQDAEGNALAGAYSPGETKGKLEVNLFQNKNAVEGTLTVGEKQNNWLISYTDQVEDKFTVQRLYASYDNGRTKIPLYITDAVDKLTAEFDLPASGDYKMLFYMATDEAPTVFRPIMEANKSVEFTKAPLILVTADQMTINHPTSKVLNIGDEQFVKLTYTYSGNATFHETEDFKWVSNNSNIATISATSGEITPVGVGKVTFNLVAMNGMDDGTKDVIKTSEEFTVKVYLGKPSLSVSKLITTKMGVPVQVMWSTNVIYINQQDEPQKDTSFSVELYEGNYATVAALAEKTPGYTANTAVNANSFTIPGEQLTKLSSGTEPAYTVKISTQNPYVSGEKVETVGNIIVASPPASVKIERPASYYMLDTAQSLAVNWASTNVNDTTGGCDFEFAVAKNGASVTTSQAASGSYTLNFADVSGKLKDVYTVTAKIKNTGDEAYSYDSFVLHVYDAEAMKIWVDKQPASTFTMDNEGRIAGMTSADIVALERNISLTNKLSINYGDYSYGLVTDQVEWQASDSKVANINYSQGGGYNNIEDYNFPSYMPDANFILAGLKDGTATINATHKLSRMTDTLGLEVKTLTDKLYLFQAMPLALTEFIYTNGDGIEKTVNSDDKGAVAIYEPNGIKGNVQLKSIFDGSIYMGTIYKVNLLSGENDGSKGQLYPINNFVLRKAAQLDLNFKNPDGTPYIGTVTIRAGVYKNGNYCESSEISDNKDAWKKPMTITPTKGFYRQAFDVNNFWSTEAGETLASSVNATDKIDYVFEFHFGNDEYQLQIIKFSGNLSGADVLRFGESIVTLEPTVDQNKPFFSTQHLDRYKKSGRLESIKNATGNIGLNAQTPKIRIDTQALWWGTPLEDTNAAISILNEKGAALAGQNYKTFKYPFATMLLTEHQIMIDESNIWINKKGRGKLTVKLFNEDGSLYNSTLQAYSIRNMLSVENISASPDVNANFQAEMQRSIKAGTSFEAEDNFTQSALDFASGIQFGNDNFSLMLAPTADPTVFKGLLQLNPGDDVMDMGPQEDSFSMMLDDDEVKTNGTGKAGFAKSRELASGLKDDIESILDDSSGNSVKYQVGGYFSCKIIYNFETEKWEIRPIGGGIRAGISYQFSHTDTQWVGTVPCTFEIKLGAAVRLEFDAHRLYEPVSVQYSDEKDCIDYYWQEDQESVTDYLTNLRIKAYIYAFGGLGIDYTVIALKVGVFGQLVLENENQFLNRNYLDTEIANQAAGYNQTEKALSGSRLNLAGQVGIKFVAKLLFISYQATFASASFDKEWTYRNWDKINVYWEETTGDMLTMDNMSLAAQSYAAATGQDSVVISEAPALESRAYLNDYSRVWSTPGGTISALSLDTNNLAPSTLQSNAYPYANPLIADDGTMMVYLSDNGSPDVWDTTANYAVKESGSYADKGKINTDAASFGDSQLSFASNNSQAISAWVSLTDKIDKNAGDELTAPEMSMMINNTEVYASIYKGSAWTTERLTNNSTPDMAPVVATNGSRAIAVWRSVYAGDASNPTDFSGKDTIVYRIYDGSQWSPEDETRTLYNGVNGSVVGLKAAMTADGTAAIAYIIDTSGTRDASSYEVVYGVVGSSGESVNNVRLTNDITADQNPQLTVAEFSGNERFMLAWNKIDGEKSDIRLATFGNDGSPKEDFIDSLSSVSSGNNIGGNFKFVNTSAANKDFKNLSILWVEPDAATGSDSLKAIKFVQETVDDNQLTFTSAAIDVAQMPGKTDTTDKTVIDSFDAYVSNPATDEVKVIILGTESKNEFDTITSGDTTIMVPKTESKMFTATETYQNKAEITAADFNYTEIMAGFIMPIAFTVQNQGKDLITSVTIAYGTESKTFDNLKILPGTSNTLLANYSVPENIADLPYSGTATFGGTTVDMTGSETLPLAVADVGISKISTVKEQEGQREFAVTLYNSSDYKLNTSGKTVKLGFYDNSAYTAGTQVVPIVTITDPGELSLIDNGAYITNLSFDIKAYLLGKGKDEIPANGVTLYAKAWVVDSSDKELAEFVGENNFSTILCENLVQRNSGNAIKVDVKQSNSATATTAVLILQNLAMAAVTNGNVAVNLLDKGGNIIRTQYLSNTAEGLVTLGSEAVISKTFLFDTLGADVEAHYFSATADSMNADLQILAASGVGVGFDKDTTSYADLRANSLKSTNITAISANPNAKVMLKDAADTVLAEETGALAYTLPLAIGSNTFKVTVAPEGAGAQPKTYALTVANEEPASGSVTLTTSVPDTRGWWSCDSVPVALTATGLTNFIPTKMQYNVDNGDWTSKTYTSSPVDVTAITDEGTYVINAKLQDTNDYNLTANSLTVKVDRTAPAFGADKTSAMLAGNTVTVSTDVTDVLSGIYSVVMTRGSATYPMQKQAGTDTYTASFTANSIGEITIVATDMAGNIAQTATGSADSVLASITAPTATTGIANGTAKTAEALGLPATVTMVTDQGNVSASVNWDVANSSYDVSTTTEQSFNVNGTVTLPGGVVNTGNVDLTTSIGVTVNAAVITGKVNAITVSAASDATSVVNGSTLQMSVTVLPADATDATVTWSVENGTGNATISASGLVTGTGVGTVTVKAMANDGSGISGTKTITITSASTGGSSGGGSSAVAKTDLIKNADSTDNVKLKATEINKAKTLTINGNGANLVFGEDVLAEMKIKSSLEAAIKQVKAEELSESAKLIVGDRPVFDIKVIADGKTVTSFGKLSIELPYTPKAGEDISKLAAFYIADDGTITQMEGSRYDNVKKAIVFTTTHLSMYAVGEVIDIVADSKFTDVVQGSWAEGYIYYLADRGIVNGKTETTFAPNDSISRAEFVTILAKMSGNTLPQGTDQFSDVPANAWYAKYVAWASQVGVAKGANGHFNPNDVITRQDMATMITRYADSVAKYNLPEGNQSKTFADDAQIASYARSAVYAMQQAGIISGRGDNTFAPAANASRAEAAKMIVVLLQGKEK